MNNHPRKSNQGTTVSTLVSIIFVSAITAQAIFTPAGAAATFTVSNLNSGGPGSLHQAIADANAAAGADTVNVSVSGTIALTVALPSLSDSTGGTTISGNGLVLDGSKLFNGESGLELRSANNVVEDFTIINFPNSGIVIDGENAVGNTIRRNFIGTDGAAKLGNRRYGVLVSGSDNVIGGTDAGAGNVISANGFSGVFIDGMAATNNSVQGNFIGTDITGMLDLGNGFFGIIIGSLTSSNVIGGTTDSAANVISFNEADGIHIEMQPTAGNTIFRNSITSNSGSGILLEAGANNDMPAPVVTGVAPLTGTAPANATVEIFADDENEGRIFVASVIANATGQFSSGLDFSAYGGMNITATATDAEGNTSGFSAPFFVDPVEAPEAPEATDDPVDAPVEPDTTPVDEPVEPEVTEEIPVDTTTDTEDPTESDTAVSTPDSAVEEFDVDLCTATASFQGQLLQFRADFGLENNDLDGDGLDDEASLVLVAGIACFDGRSEVVEATLNAFEINLMLLDAEAMAADVATYRELLAVLLSVGEAMKSAVLTVLSDGGVVLENGYVTVACEDDVCMPAQVDGLTLSEGFDVFDAPSVSLNEVFVSAGDLDADGFLNEVEMANVLANGGGLEEYAVAAISPLLNGTESEIAAIADEIQAAGAVSCSGAIADFGGPANLMGDFGFIALVLALLVATKARKVKAAH